MKDAFRQSMAWLHTWVGLLAGWILYFVFITGTAGYLNFEIDRWMQPELPQPKAPPASSVALAQTQTAFAYLAEQAPDAQSWWVDLPGTRSYPHLTAWWQTPDAEGGEWFDVPMDPERGTPYATRETGGGQALYVMHYDLHYMPAQWGIWIVGVCTMFMLVALVTGIVVHKRIFKDFFTFRPGRGQRAWLDAHNASSVVTLPFQLMITYSGLVFFLLTYMPFVATAVYGPGDAGRAAYLEERYGARSAQVEAAGERAQALPLETFWTQAHDAWPAGMQVRYVEIRNPNDANARVIIAPANDGWLRSERREAMEFAAVSGEPVASQPASQGAASALQDVLLDLHEGHFSEGLLRAMYVLAGLLSAAMIATGAVLWTVKRRTHQGTAHAGLAIVETLNAGTFVGLLTAIAAYFWANRLLPLTMADRASWELHALFLVWLGTLVHAALRSRERVWVEQFYLAATAFAALPVINGLTTERHLLASLQNGDLLFLGFDLGFIVLAIVLAWAGRRAQTRTGSAITKASTEPRLDVPADART